MCVIVSPRYCLFFPVFNVKLFSLIRSIDVRSSYSRQIIN